MVLIWVNGQKVTGHKVTTLQDKKSQLYRTKSHNYYFGLNNVITIKCHNTHLTCMWDNTSDFLKIIVYSKGTRGTEQESFTASPVW